jgi:hypothetical protein
MTGTRQHRLTIGEKFPLLERLPTFQQEECNDQITNQ